MPQKSEVLSNGMKVIYSSQEKGSKYIYLLSKNKVGLGYLVQRPNDRKYLISEDVMELERHVWEIDADDEKIADWLKNQMITDTISKFKEVYYIGLLSSNKNFSYLFEINPHLNKLGRRDFIKCKNN